MRKKAYDYDREDKLAVLTEDVLDSYKRQVENLNDMLE
jgi:hypothetical protein